MYPEAIITQVQTTVGVTADGIAGPKTWAAIYQKILGQAPASNDPHTLIAAIQTKIGVTADGIPGPVTWGAISSAVGANAQPAPVTGNDTDPVDSRSESVISTLLPEVRPLARQLVHKAAAAGITIKIISGLRSYATQNALYAQGRTTPGPIVTNAQGGYSNHNFGLAFDIGVFENGQYMGNSPSYAAVGPLGKSIGLAWGGDWVTIKDMPHYELRPAWAATLSESAMLAGLRQRTDSGSSMLA